MVREEKFTFQEKKREVHPCELTWIHHPCKKNVGQEQPFGK